MKKLFIPIILGTSREDRKSEIAAKYLIEKIKTFDVETEIIDTRNFISYKTIPPWEENNINSRYKQIIKKADGLVIITPEYNHGYPGELKLLMDRALEEYAKKPAAVCGVSNGGLGGARVVEMFRLVLVAYKMVPINSAVYFSNIDSLFDDNNNIKDDRIEVGIEKMMKELMWYTKVLKYGREEM
jgi:NAD(P)H-dependent FMN reductase